MSGILSIGAGGDTGFYDFPLDQALRFNDDDSSYLQRTPSSTGNRTTWTWSCWIKRSNISYSSANMFGAYSGSNDFEYIRFDSDDCIRYTYYVSGSVQNLLKTSGSFRDTSAWYHILVQRSGSSSEIYVNGVQQDLQTETRASSNGYLNHTVAHDIGRFGGTSQHFDGYMAEMNFVDGTSLNPTSFGETKNGIWIPKEYTGSYGTNGFRLTFKDDTTVEGFNTVLWTGNGESSRSVQGVGFSPDLVWTKMRSDQSISHQWYDTVRGTGNDKEIASNGNNAEGGGNSEQYGYLNSFDTDGFTGVDGTGSPNYYFNQDGKTYVAWNWKAGGAPTVDNSAGAGNTPTAGSVKIDGANLGSALAGATPATRLSANTTRGFSIVEFTSPSSGNSTVAHGLTSTPEMIIMKDLDTSGYGNWSVFHDDVSTDTSKYLLLNGQGAVGSVSNVWGAALPTSTVFGFGVGANIAANDRIIGYCWHSVSGYSKIGSYTGTGSSGHAITTGFAPAWLMVKRTDASNSWYIVDNTRTVNTAAGNDDLLYANLSSNEGSTNDFFTFTSTGFELNTNSPAVNTSGGEYIYMAFADTREYAFWTDQSGNNNDFQHNNLEHIDVKPDRPTNNFATLNPLLFNTSPTLEEGNLEATLTSSSGQSGRSRLGSTFHITSGKWYWELTLPGTGDYVGFGISRSGFRYMLHTDPSEGVGFASFQTQSTAAVTYYAKDSTGSTAISGTGPTVTNIVQIALDADNGKMWVGNGTNFYSGDGSGDITGTSGDPAAGTNASFTSLDFSEPWTPMIEMTGASETETFIINFGQNGDFNGTEVSQGNTDSRGHGDFYYAPPTGFLALCSENLPDPGIDPNKGETPQDYFNTVLYTGNQSVRTISGVGFQPDWVWAKRRSGSAESHILVDSVRGATKTLKTNTSNQEGTNADGITGFDADGFTLGTSLEPNTSSANYVAWNWKAGGSAVSNDDGDVTSSVSASPESGFSIVTYTATGSGDITVGHGLGIAPEFIIGKVRNQAYGWVNFALPAGSGAVVGFGTNAAASGSGNVAYGKTAPTTSVFTAGRGSEDNMNYGSGDTVVAYCIAPIEGYSKVGSYIGNGSTSGPFIFTGFRPAWILFKRIDGGTHHWRLFDSVRNTFNEVDEYLTVSNSNTEATGKDIDFLSNGFRIITTDTDTDTSGGEILYVAFAEQPFKYANAR